MRAEGLRVLTGVMRIVWAELWGRRFGRPLERPGRGEVCPGRGFRRAGVRVGELDVRDGEGKRVVQRIAMELKVWRDRDKKGDPLERGMAQLDEYLGRLGLEEGVLVVFDCRAKAEAIEERTRIEEGRTPSGRRVTVLRG
jgi:hypothetical protein